MKNFFCNFAKKITKFPAIFALMSAWFFFGWPQVWHNPSIPPEIKKIQAKVAPLKIKDKTIDFIHTDDNSNENLIIKTDEKTYLGLTRAEVYFSVTNIGNHSEQVNLQAYFPEKNGQVKKIEKWTENISYETDIPDYGSMDYFCEEGWEKKISTFHSPQQEEDEKEEAIQSESEEGEHYYQCSSTGEKRICDTLDEDKKCHIKKTQVGSHKETNRKNEWGNIKLSDSSLPINQDFFKKIFGDKTKRKSIPSDLKVKKSTEGDGYRISQGETQYFKMEINFSPNSSGEFYIEAIGDKGGYGLLDPWWNSSWSYRKQITIDHTKVDGDLTYFPVLINLSSDANLVANAQDNGDDIAFTSSDEVTQLDHEIESFNDINGELQAWVEVPTLSASSDTVIYMYYGNSTCGSQEDISGTWDSNHKLVHHLNDLTTSTTEDSTSNNNDATKRAANEPTETDGKIGKAQSFDGSNDYDKITNTVITSPAALTISSWFKKPGDGPSYECALHQSSDATIGNSAYWLGVCSSNYLTATIGARAGAGWSAGKTTTTATYGEWYHLAASWDGSIVRVYINGNYNKQYNLGSYSNLTTPTRFGASNDGTTYQFKGIVDEIRISTTNRSAAWIKTSHNNQNSPSSFYSLGAETGVCPTTLHNIPFDNEETPDTTPIFEFTAEDPYGISDLVYQIEWDDNISFSSPTTKASDTDAGFVNTENGSDTSPFTENQRIRFTVQAGDALSNSAVNTSYYWRVRAKNNGGSFGAWTNINSLRVDSSLSVSQWTQTVDEQFDTGVLTNTETSGSDGVELSAGIDIKSARGTFITPSTTGNHAVTGVGFTPKAIMLYVVPRINESVGSNAGQSFGFSDGTRHRVSSIKSGDGVYDNGRTQDNNYVLALRNPAGAITYLSRASVSSFDSDGFTLNYNIANSGYVVHYIAFGGDDLSAYVGNKLVSASPLTGLSFAPDIIFTATTGLSSGNDDTHGIHSFGVVDKNNFWHRGSHQGSNNGTKDSWLTSNSVSSQTYSNGVTWQMTNVSLTSDGMSWSGSNTDHFQYLALNLDGNKTKVGLFQKETTGGDGTTQDLTGWGFTNDAAIVGFASTGKTSTALSDHCHFTHGSYDGTNQGMVGMGDANASTASKSIQNNDNAITIINTGAVIQVGGTASQLDNDGVRFTWSPNNISAYYMGYWAIEGSVELAASGSIISSAIDYDWVSGMGSWDKLSWNDDETNGDIKYQLQYWDGDSWELIPDGSLSGNSTGFDASPVDLSGLSTTTYNQIKIKANLTNSGGSPTLQDWTITWVEAGSLGVDIVDSGGASVGSPSISFSSATFDWSGQQTSGTLGVTDEKIRVTNGTSTPAWSLTVSATGGAGALWDSGTYTYDFNDTAANGRLEVDPSSGTVSAQTGCSATTGISKGSAAYFDSGNNITLITADGTADTGCWWDIIGIDLDQDIPSEQEADSYSINITLTVT